MTTVEIHPVTEPTELFRRYDGESFPQPVHVRLDLRTGRLDAAYSPQIGTATSVEVWSGQVQTWRIPPLAAHTANQLLSTIAPTAQRLLDDAEVERNRDGQLVAILGTDAQQAHDEIEQTIASWVEYDAPTVEEWTADDWFAEGDSAADEYGITAETTDDELAAIAARIEQDIVGRAETPTVVTGALSHVTAARTLLRSALRDELEAAAEQIRAAEQQRDDLVRRICAWGDPVDTDRSVATLADRSHTWVRYTRQQRQAVHTYAECGHRADYASEAEHDQDCPAMDPAFLRRNR